MVFQWFPMVANHWSNDGMVTIHRYGLFNIISKRTFVVGHISGDLRVFGRTKLSIDLQLEDQKTSVLAREDFPNRRLRSPEVRHSDCGRAAWLTATICNRMSRTEVCLGCGSGVGAFPPWIFSFSDIVSVRLLSYFLRSWEQSEIFVVDIFVVVDAIGLETDFTLETEWKQNYWRELKTPEVHFSDLKFLTMMKIEMEKKHVLYIVPQF